MSDSPAKILDLTYLIEASDGDVDFIADIVNDYLTEMKKHISELRTSSATHDIPLLLRAAHTVKGASANVGANRVKEVAARLEMQAKKGIEEGSLAMIEIISQETARVRDVVEREGIAHLLRAS
jgi:HPt (histidine-containing phosphotransfer) domain-containing protein